MSSLSQAATAAEKRTNARYWIVVMLFIVTSFNYGDRATLSIAGSEMAVISALIRWGWGMCSPPSHGLMSSARSRAVGCSTASARSASISGRSSSGRCLPCCRASSISSAALALSLRCLPCASSSALPSRRHSRQQPDRRRPVPGAGEGDRVSIFNSAQYFATVIFAPIMGWLTHEVGWSHVFFFMGGLGIVISFVWLKVIHDPNNHPGVNQKELDYIAEGGALINMDQKSSAQKVPFSVKMGQIKQLIGSRMMIGIYIGQYCINALTYFFITGSRFIWCRRAACRSSKPLCRPFRRCAALSAGCWAG